jgi:membrane-bound serine protease (ClpP class)
LLFKNASGTLTAMKNNLICAFSFLLASLCLAETNQIDTVATAIETPAATPVIVIPVTGMIERGLLHVMRRALDQAREQNAAAVVLDMDTPGGRVDVTETLMRLLLDLPGEMRTFTFIREDALSAGALIAVATGDIYMAPGSRIGASAIVGAGGDIDEGDLKEKHVSALVALVRSAALTRGHDPELFESMIRRDMEYVIDDEIIVKEGQLLTLSDREAARLVGTNGNQRPLLSSGTVGSIEEMLTDAGITYSDVSTISVTPAERIARWIEMFAFLFLAGGLLGIYIEFRTPGFGLPGIAGITLLAIFFWGHRIAGLSGDLELLLFTIGALLLLIEIFVIPGFGITGIAGITFMLIAIFFSMAAPLPDAPWFQIPTIDLHRAMLNLALSFVFTLGLGTLVSRYLPKAVGFRNLVLETALTGTASGPPAQDDQQPAIRAGDTGTATTALRPAGYARINGERIGVVAEGNFLDENEPVIVHTVQGSRVVVGRHTMHPQELS